MAKNLLRSHPELQPLVLSNVRTTGIVIGSGAYGSVVKVDLFGVQCAAKRIHDFFQDSQRMPAAGIREMSSKFVKECLLTSTLRHPNIVQFLGICFFSGSRLPAIVMELLMTSLHDLLEPEPRPQILAYIPLGVKHSILRDVATGLQYLHRHIPPIVHRDLSAKNVLLSSAMVGKIADLGMVRIAPRLNVAATMTTGSVYLPPEAVEVTSNKDDKHSSQYSMKIDIFSLGIVTIFTLSHTFPCDLLPHKYYNQKRKLVARTELERREVYMNKVYSQFSEGHPFICMIEQSVHDDPEERPDIEQMLELLQLASDEIAERERDMNKLELLQAVRELTLHSQTLQDQAENVS